MEASISRPEKIFWTKDYSIFKKLKGNRGVDPKRVNKVLRSIKTFGFLCDPIRVTRNMEVGEGQATLKAYEILGEEVPYFIDPNLTAETARALNSSRTPWKETDYIESFAIAGKESYKFLDKMIKTYADIPVSTVEDTCSGSGRGGGTTRLIRTGKYEISIEGMIKAEKKLRYLHRFSGVINRAGGRKDYWYKTLSFCYDEPSISNEKLAEKFQTYSADITPCNDLEVAIAKLDLIYNKGSKTGKVWIRHLYEVAKEKK